MAAECKFDLSISHHLERDPIGLSEIFAAEKSVAVWQRDSIADLSGYFELVSNSLKVGLRDVYSIENLRQHLAERLPDAAGKQQAIDDIHMLADMLTCLFDCQQVGLRLVTLTSAMCPRFHVDHIPVRLVCTYVGAGTEWVPNDTLRTLTSDASEVKLSAELVEQAQKSTEIQQLRSFDVALLKGSAWSNSIGNAAIHRSCGVNHNATRVLLTLDPM